MNAEQHDHSHAHGDGSRLAQPGAQDGAMGSSVRDPVCGMVVDPRRAAHRVDHQGSAYWFCSSGCQAKFEADPLRYASSGAASSPADAAGHAPHSHGAVHRGGRKASRAGILDGDLDLPHASRDPPQRAG